jgi:hypothetical protein
MIMDQLNGWNGESEDYWDPQPSETLVGIVLEIRTATGKFSDYPVLTVREDGTDRVLQVPIRCTMLQRQFNDLAPHVGDRIGLKYAGDHAEKGYKLFKMVVEHLSN